MSSLELYPLDERLPRGERVMFNLYMITALLLFVLMMLLGLTMRMTQAEWTPVLAGMFYKIMTMHGAGMVGTMSLASTAVMWFFLRKYVSLHLWAFVSNYVLFMLAYNWGGLLIPLGLVGLLTFYAWQNGHSSGVQR